jgi:predicted MFS family arabinose efflux permease
VRSYGAVYGTIFGLFAIGAGAGPSLLGYAYDRAGTYSQIMQACAVLLLFSALVLLALGRYPDHTAQGARTTVGPFSRASIGADR